MSEKNGEGRIGMRIIIIILTLTNGRGRIIIVVSFSRSSRVVASLVVVARGWDNEISLATKHPVHRRDIRMTEKKGEKRLRKHAASKHVIQNQKRKGCMTDHGERNAENTTQTVMKLLHMGRKSR